MSRIPYVRSDEAQGKAKEILEQIKAQRGKVPNIFKAMANSPAATEAYLNFSQTLSKGVLDPKLKEQIALSVAEENKCDYCLAAHSVIASKAGLSADEITASRRSSASNPKSDAGLKFAQTVIRKKGHISDEEFQKVKSAGFSDAAIVEMIMVICQNIITNYFNHIADPEIDFPKANPV